MELKTELILIRYGELSTKGKNRKDFISKLTQNVKNALSEFDALKYDKTYDRLYIYLNGTKEDEILERLKKVFGIQSFSCAVKTESDLDQIIETAYQVALSAEGKTFKVETRRHDKKFFKTSDEINRAVAGKILKNTDWKVDVHQPDLRIQIEVRENCTYIMKETIRGAGGYPVGVGGKAMLMLSGGIDSPVAGYLTMKRGVAIECVHYASPPYTSSSARKKVLDLASMISVYQGSIKVTVIPFTELQLAIYEHCDESYAITIMRRMMFRIAEEVAKRHKAMAIVTGESIGQVASQTLESMTCINDVINMPVLRPVACFDKLEIIDVAKKIDTYETSILPFEDCCTIFTPKSPVTKPTLKRCEQYESHFDFEPLIQKCIDEAEIIWVKPGMSEDQDLF